MRWEWSTGRSSPPNVLLSRFGRPQLADFVPASLSVDYERLARRSADNAGYVAPEIRNGGSSSAATDMYGLAATVATLLTGSSRDFSTATMRAAGASDELATVLGKALAEKSPDRFATMEAFRGALAEVPEARTIRRWARAPAADRADPQPGRVAAATAAAAPAGALAPEVAGSGALTAAGEPAAASRSGGPGGPGGPAGPGDPPPGFARRRRSSHPWRRPGLAVLAVGLVALVTTGVYKEMNSLDTATPTRPAAATVVVSVPTVTTVAPTMSSTCRGYTCQFRNQAATLPPGARLQWNFGDGHTQTTRSGEVSHTYAKSGPYLVVMTETDRGTTGLSSRRLVTLSSWSRTARLSAHARGSLQITIAVSSSQSACRTGRYVLQRLDAGSWATAGSGTVAATGSRTFAAPSFGTYRATVGRTPGTNGECGSATTGRVTLRRPFTPPTVPLPTIHSSAPPPPPPPSTPPSTPPPTHKTVPTPSFGPPP